MTACCPPPTATPPPDTRGDNQAVADALGQIVTQAFGKFTDVKKAGQWYSVFASGPGIFGLGSQVYADDPVFAVFDKNKKDIWDLRNPDHVNGGVNHFGSPTPRSPQTLSLASPGPPAALPPPTRPVQAVALLPVATATAVSPAASAVEGAPPDRSCLFDSGALRLRAPSPPAADPFAVGAPDPPKHDVAPRGERRCRRNPSRLRFGTLTACGHLPRDPGGGREIGHFPWRALGRFRARDRVLGRSRDRWSPGQLAARHSARAGLAVSRPRTPAPPLPSLGKEP